MARRTLRTNRPSGKLRGGLRFGMAAQAGGGTVALCRMRWFVNGSSGASNVGDTKQARTAASGKAG